MKKARDAAEAKYQEGMLKIKTAKDDKLDEVIPRRRECSLSHSTLSYFAYRNVLPLLEHRSLLHTLTHNVYAG